MMNALRRRWIRFTQKYAPLLARPRHSYWNETCNDRWIIEYVFPWRRGGYFLEVGAAGGIHASSCAILDLDYDWDGICIEANDAFFADLVKNRPHSRCVQACLTGEPREVEYLESGYLGGIRENIRDCKTGAEELLETASSSIREGRPLADVLRECGSPKIIDFAAIDIEGSELEVLAAFPFDEYQFRALALECDGKIWDPITQLLKGAGYVEVTNPFNHDKPWERYWFHGSFRLD